MIQIAVLKDRNYEKSKCKLSILVENKESNGIASNLDTLFFVDVIISFDVGDRTLRQERITCAYEDLLNSLSKQSTLLRILADAFCTDNSMNNNRQIYGIRHTGYDICMIPLYRDNNDELLHVLITTINTVTLNSNSCVNSGSSMFLTVSHNSVESFIGSIKKEMDEVKLEQSLNNY